jgi:LuxR family transcriptional regulator, maltose regulon positive regulatory protein
VHSVTARAAPGPPAALTGELMRTRLLSLMSGRFDRPVTTLVAGAGFGKTTLLAQAWRQNLTAPVGIDAWVSCQPDDEDPKRFVAACCRTLGPDQAAIQGRAGDVIAAIRQMSPIDVCLLIDDTHHLVGSAAKQVLTEVVPQLPVNGHVVLSGRVPMDVPLARLFATGGCVEIGEHDLSFTPAEEADIARLLDASPPPRELAGWPALVRLALTAQRKLTQQFLWEEVVASLSPLEARALLALALVGWADAAELSAICGEQVELERLTTKIPLVTISEGQAARAHDLWGESVDRLYSREQILSLNRAGVSGDSFC